MQITIGANAKAYFLSTGSRATWGALSGTTGFHEGAAPANLTEITSLVDVTMDTGGSTVEATTRGNSPVATNDYGLEQYTLSLSIRHSKADTFMLAVAKVRGAKTGIAIAVLDGDKATSAQIGYWGDWVVDGDPRAEPLGESIMLNYSFRPWSGSAIKPVERIKTT